MITYTACTEGFPLSSNACYCFQTKDHKRCKVKPHLQFSLEHATLYMDANISLKNPEAPEVLLGDADMALFAHPWRSTVWQEFNELEVNPRFRNNKGLQDALTKQRRFYADEGLPLYTGLWECGVLIRRNNLAVNSFMEAWWKEITRWQPRDQVSFPYVLWKFGQGIKINTITPDVRHHPDFGFVNLYGQGGPLENHHRQL